MSRRSRFGLVILPSVMLAAVMVTSVSAQIAFRNPAYGGYVAYHFNATNAAKSGWYHSGADYYGPGKKSTWIQASSVGVVHSITKNNGNDRGMGNCVIIRHSVPVSSRGVLVSYYTLYAHLDAIENTIKVGGVVTAGQNIGTMGSTGYGNRFHWGKTPHLHFEVKTSGVLSNPSGSGTYFGYMPRNAGFYGYVDPAAVIGKWKAVPASH